MTPASAQPEPVERLFVAVALPPPVRDALADLSEPLSGVAWTRPAQLHLTLRFLGDVSLSLFDPIVERLARIRVEPFLLPIEGLGTFPPNRPPRVIWAGVGRGHPRLFQLRKLLDEALLATGLPLDVRTFHPHVTLARCSESSAAAVTRWLRAHPDFVAPPFRVDAIDLWASDLRPDGAVHTLKKRFALDA